MYGQKVLVTGPTGFIGARLCQALSSHAIDFRLALRRPQRDVVGDIAVVGDIDGDTDWSGSLAGVRCVVHLAARVHVMHDSSAGSLAKFRRTNVAGTERLARQASSAGVSRFVYISSIKVNGERTNHIPFRENDPPTPQDAYGKSKWEAEEVLYRLARETGLEVVVLRPPLVYGPGVKANFLRILDIAASGVPLPFESVANHRSFLFVDNLIDAILRCLDHPNARDETFLVCDREDLSTPELIRRLRRAMGKPMRLFSVSPSLLRAGAALIGCGNEAARLLDSLVVDSSQICTTLGWQPPHAVNDGLQMTVDAYLAERAKSSANRAASL